jgi:isopentenyl-diphosphate delta-isomerase
MIDPVEQDTVEQVVLVDDEGRAIGIAPKHEVHHRSTPLHLAFSCYVFDREGAFLVTRRALHKRTFPGAWTNTFCGHPGPGEDMFEAIHRRARQELGITLSDLQPVLPRFRYQAVMADGTRENEICPVFTAVTSDPVRADADEVADHAWVDWPRFSDEVRTGSREVSPWCVQQLHELGHSMLRPARREALPPAARQGR